MGVCELIDEKSVTSQIVFLRSFKLSDLSQTSTVSYN